MKEHKTVSANIPFTELESVSITCPDVVTKDEDSPTGYGYQKVAEKHRFSKLSEYYEEGGVPTPIILSCRNEDLYGEVSGWLNFDRNTRGNQLSKLLNGTTLHVVDGQHRLGGFRNLYERLGVDLEVPVQIIFGLSLSEEMSLFNKINHETRKMPKAINLEERTSIYRVTVLEDGDDTGEFIELVTFHPRKKEVAKYILSRARTKRTQNGMPLSDKGCKEWLRTDEEDIRYPAKVGDFHIYKSEVPKNKTGMLDLLTQWS